MADQTPVTHDLSKLLDKIKDVRIAMLTTFDEQNELHSRPMFTQKPEADGNLLFFTDADSAKVYEVKQDQHVNLSYAHPGNNVYASVTGHASVYRDQAKIDELWSEDMRAWFPKGKEDPSIRILKVEIQKAEYWDSPSSLLSRAYGYVRAVATGERSKDDDVNQHAQVKTK
ncbi:pyridoxamine 5'-phosphate oxidase family protein [Hymenobacter busanensis]|uniref:Pyridoxamine 5'-phosphate oxidase family protein n=1 Tax=Hymenobacter busanensis TaxID=2607656 RepID=A0A7L4ZSI5_9BACT|nr:pyridoxamine 5'-phosphate oxidase family protein [Hymenobacter busanensis]KAA9325876.1 pyridoxamine 5'-phosphate oxidase family protein [Hymenobacter busanensis]QHJ06284.1 pyridoxamine 5'-phosphate oxidase family protein [Hymenobacter busanensis]